MRILKPRYRTGNPNRHYGSRKGMTAAGFRVRRDESDLLRRLMLPWQARSFAYYDMLGEIKYAAQFYARMLAPLKIYAAEKDDAGDWVETTNPDALDALERIQDPGGGRTNLLSSYGRLMFLTGECYLLVTTDPDTDEEQWEMLSTDELRPQGNTYVRYRAPSLPAEEYREPDDDDWEPLDANYAIAYRLWRKHPRYSLYADATMQGVLDLCEELVLLTQAVRARARSRLAGSGILFISDDFSMKPLEPVPDEDPLEDPFMADLTEAMMAPIADEGTASAIVPLIVRGKTEAIDKGIKHVQIIDPTQVYPETGLRYECIKRIAIGLDMPPEILLGLGENANHWTAWQIDEQTWKSHGLPLAVQFCDDLTQAYFRPYLRDNGTLDADRFAILYDATDVINHPDLTKNALDLYDRVIIGKEAVRDAAGFSEEDAPSEEERAERIGILVRDGSLAWYGEPTVRGGVLETAPGTLEDVSGGSDGTDTTGASTGSEVEKGPPKTNPAERPMDDITASMIAARILGAADLALLRARESAGNRVKSAAKRDTDAVALINGSPARNVPAILGREKVRELLGGRTGNELVVGSSEMVMETFRMLGLDPKIAELIAGQVERHAARTLYDEHPALPATFADYVVGLVKTGA